MFPDQPVDIQRRPYHVRHDPFRGPYGLFQAEKAVFTFETDLPGGTVQVQAPMLAHEFMGFTVPGKMDFASVLLQVMPEVKGPRGMPEPFPADNKKELHENPAHMICSVFSYYGAGQSSGGRRGLLR
jgi:hypothetical protein